MPMNKNSTSYYYSIQQIKKHNKATTDFTPSDKTINEILKYANFHKTAKMSKNVFVDYSLN